MAARQAKQQQEAEVKERRDRALAVWLEKCKKTNDFALYELQERILQNVEWKSAAQQQIERENKIAEVSGAEDLASKYRAGERVVSADEAIDLDWPKYKSLGGSATSPDSIRHTLTNPCNPRDAGGKATSGVSEGKAQYAFELSEGTPVSAVASGVVSWVGERPGYGLVVEIDHGNELKTRISNNARVLVSQGVPVKKGQSVAICGRSAKLEVLKNGTPVDLLQFIK